MAQTGFLPRDALHELFTALTGAGYRVVGPRARDGVIVYDTLAGAGDLPRGLRDEQAPGSYRLAESDSPRCFAWANGPQALKPLTFAPREILWRVARDGDGRLAFQPAVPDTERIAVIGVRACDLAALDLQDRHFLDSDHVDGCYQARRAGLLLIAVHCHAPAATCFCHSTGDGPRAVRGYDLALAELDEGFIVETGSEAGGALFDALNLAPVSAPQSRKANAELRAAADSQRRALPGRDLKGGLFKNLDHPRFNDLGNRCLACGNCTMVCPTCFCHGETETPALDGSGSSHAREWGSCFNAGHSYFAHTVVRATTAQRYRQWLTHKLGFWHDQYGRSGCVGCGRCIAWCPVGIDITEEANAVLGHAHD